MDKPILTAKELEKLTAEEGAKCKNPFCSGLHALNVACLRCESNEYVTVVYLNGVLTLTCPLCHQVVERFLIGG